jgi:hypothetical protein
MFSRISKSVDYRIFLNVSKRQKYVQKYTSPWAVFELTILVVIGTDYNDSCKSNDHDHDETSSLLNLI